MSRDVLYHSAVQAEIREILDYYGGISGQLADDFWEELTDAFEYAGRFPERHHFDASGRRRSNLSRFPYHFLFRTSISQSK
jgi:plasmid stabilization system protein ParE